MGTEVKLRTGSDKTSCNQALGRMDWKAIVNSI